MSRVMRLNLMGFPTEVGSLSEPTGKERIPSARSINSTTDSISSIDRTNVTVDVLLPWCRLTLPFGGGISIPNPNTGSP